MRRRRLALVVLVFATLSAGCATSPERAEYMFGAGDQYVALGDSYTAAPGIGPADADDGCFRSLNNYPHLVARATGLELVDTSCSGASTDSITGRQHGLTGQWRAPQLDAVDEHTDVVSIGIGGNDFGLYNLLAIICPQLAERDPGGSPCEDADSSLAPGQDLASKLEEVERRDTAVVRAVRARAPNATILLVGYPAIVPEHGACPELPVAPGDVPFVRRLTAGLNEALAGAAEQTNVTYVDVYARTEGHDVCSDDPWVAGAHASHGRAAIWHPYASEQVAVAKAVEAALRAR
jgi:hypothetical protein